MVEYAYKENGVMKLKPVALSLSQSEIEEIATELLEAMQPDWQNAVEVTFAQLNTSYVCPSDGMIVGWGYVTSSDGSSTITVNGVAVSSEWRASPSFSFMNIQCQVSKGDLVKSGRLFGAGKVSFVPFKTSNPVSLRPLDPHKIDTAILNHWDDITSDFSTAGSAAGFVLDRAVYNPILRKLRVSYHITSSWAAGTAKYFIITYNGSDLPAFTRSCFYRSCKIESDTYNSGFEDSYVIQQSNKLNINMFNRNVNASWAANTTSFTTQIEF